MMWILKEHLEEIQSQNVDIYNINEEKYVFLFSEETKVPEY